MINRLPLQNLEFEIARDRMRMLAWLGIFGHPVFYVLWLYLFPQQHESWIARALFVVLALVWLVWDWFEKDSMLPFRLYSWFFMTIAIPFFFSYMYLMNEASSVWLGSLICGILYLALILDVPELVAVTVIGSVFAIGTVFINGFPMHAANEFLSHIPVILFALVGGIGFKYQQSQTIGKNRDSAMVLAGSIAHELRTPMLGMRLELEALGDMVRLPDTSTSHLESLSLLEQHHRKSSWIIDALLQNVQRGEIDRSAFQEEDMGEIVAGVIDMYPFSAGQRKLVSREGPGSFRFAGDGFLMNQVLINLIGNALQSIAAAEKGTIEIGISRDGKYNVLYVEDTGLGLHRRDRARIFKRFYSKTRGGAGLGLAFCQRVVSSFGGRIKVDSREGVFTRISILLPKLH